MRWFVEWLDRSDLEPRQVCAIQRSARVKEEQLAQIRALTAEMK